jgi:hypothetical protein
VAPQIRSPLQQWLQDSTPRDYRAELEGDVRRFGEFQSQEVAKRIAAIPDATELQRRAVADNVSQMAPSDLLRNYSEAFRSMESFQSIRAKPIVVTTAAQDSFDELTKDHPYLSFAFDMMAGASSTVQDLALSANQINTTALRLGQKISPTDGLANFFGTFAGHLENFGDDYRARMMSGKDAPISGELGEFVQMMNHRASLKTWGTATGSVAAQAMPSVASVLRNANMARGFTASTLALFGTYAAGQGIEKYRRESLMKGETPNPMRAMAIGIGYGASEIVIEHLDHFIPIGHIGSHAASKIGEAIIRRDAKSAAHYMANLAGHATSEGIEEVLTGELQSLIDMTAITGKWDRSWGDRMRDFGGGAAGSGFTSLAASVSPQFRKAMMTAPQPLTQGGHEAKLIKDFAVAAKRGDHAAVVEALSRAGNSLTTEARALRVEAITKLAEKMGKPEIGALAVSMLEADAARQEATSGPRITPEQAIAEYAHDVQAAIGTAVTMSVADNESLPAQTREAIGTLEKLGVRVVAIEPNESLPFPAFSGSDPRVIVVQLGTNADSNARALEFGWITHEITHTIRAQHPEIYSDLVNATAGAVVAHAAEYANDLAKAGAAADVGAVVLNMDRFIDEGAARMVQMASQRAGLTSVLSPTESTAMQKIGDFIRRRAGEAGLRGPVVKAVIRAFDAMQQKPKAGAQEERAQPSRSTAKLERFGAFATRRGEHEHQGLLFTPEAVRIFEAMADARNPGNITGAPPSQQVATEKKQSSKFAKAMNRIGELERLADATFANNRLVVADLKYELSALVHVAVPGEGGQQLAAIIQGATTYAEINAAVASAYGLYAQQESTVAGEEAKSRAAATADRVRAAIGESSEAPRFIMRNEVRTIRSELNQLLAQQESATGEQLKALKAASRAQQKRLNAAIIAAKNEERQAARERAANLTAEFQTEIKAARQRLEDANAKREELRKAMLDRLAQTREAFRQRARDLKNLREKAVDLVNSLVPPALRGRFLLQVARVSTPKRFNKIIAKIITTVEAYQHAKAMMRAAKIIVNLAGRRMHPTEKAAFLAAVESTGSHPGAIRRPSDRTLARLQAREDYLNANPDALMPDKWKRELVRLTHTPIADLTTSQLEDLSNELDGILGMSKLRRRLVKSQYERAVEAAAKQASAELSTTGQGVARAEIANPEQRGFGHTAREFFRLGHMKLNTVLEWTFGDNSFGKRVFYDALLTGHRNRLAAHQADIDYIKATLGKNNIELGSIDLATMSKLLADQAGWRMATWTSLPQKVRAQEHSIVLGGKGGGTLKLTSAERIYTLGLFRDSYAMSRLLGGTPFMVKRTGQSVTLDADRIRAIRASATPTEQAIADAMYEHINGPIAQRLREWSIRALGYDITNDGYWPVSRSVAAVSEIPTIFTAKTLRSSNVLRDRTGDKSAPFIVTDAFGMFSNHSWVVSSVSHLERALTFARNVLDSSDVQDSMKKYWKDNIRKYLQNRLNDVTVEGHGQGFGQADAWLAPGVAKLRANLVRGVLGANPRVTLSQPISVALAMTQMSASDLTRSIASRAMFDSSIDNEIRQYSPILRHRMESSSTGLISEVTLARGEFLGFKEGWVMGIMGTMDHLATRSIWRAAVYEAERANQNMNHDQVMMEAAKRAEEVVLSTQPAWDTLHQSGVAREAAHNPFVSVLTLFTSQLNQNWNIIARDVIRIQRANGSDERMRAWGALGKSSALVLIANTMGWTLFKHLWDMFLKLFGAKTDDRRLVDKFLQDGLQSTAESFYGGTIVSYAIDNALGTPHQYASSGETALTRTMLNAARAIGQAARNHHPTSPGFRRDIERAAVESATLAGVPTAPYRLFMKLRDGGGGAPSSAGQSTSRGRSARSFVK